MVRKPTWMGQSDSRNEYPARNHPAAFYEKYEPPKSASRILAPQVGLEPTTRRLTVACSTIELLRNRNARRILACSRANPHETAAVRLAVIACACGRWLPDQDSNLG
jgi:hypothetical protein